MATKAQDLKTLNRLYNKAVDRYEARIDELEVAFNRRCEEIRTISHKKLADLPKNDRTGRRQVLVEEKKELDQVVRELKTAIRESSQETQKTCEKIQSQIDTMIADVENELNAL